MSFGREGVHHGYQWSRCFRQAEADTGTANVFVYEGNVVTEGPHSRGRCTKVTGTNPDHNFESKFLLMAFKFIQKYKYTKIVFLLQKCINFPCQYWRHSFFPNSNSDVTRHLVTRIV